MCNHKTLSANTSEPLTLPSQIKREKEKSGGCFNFTRSLKARTDHQGRRHSSLKSNSTGKQHNISWIHCILLLYLETASKWWIRGVISWHIYSEHHKRKLRRLPHGVGKGRERKRKYHTMWTTCPKRNECPQETPYPIQQGTESLVPFMICLVVTFFPVRRLRKANVLEIWASFSLLHLTMPNNDLY